MGIIRETGEYFEFKCKPDHGVLRKKLKEPFTDRYTIRLCYDACYIGYSLCRYLRKSEIHCDVIAPSLIPVKTGTRVKTDQLDAAKLAEYYAKDLLAPIYIPDETDEEIRDIMRSRNFLVKQRKMLKTHILSATSGGKERKRGITKTGNKHIRTILIEYCQTATRLQILSKRIKQSRAGQPQAVIDIADRCMSRFYKKATRMFYAGKHKNKIKTACARELLGFVWEAQRIVA